MQDDFYPICSRPLPVTTHATSFPSTFSGCLTHLSYMQPFVPPVYARPPPGGDPEAYSVNI
jgi:hypothetical protein